MKRGDSGLELKAILDMNWIPYKYIEDYGEPLDPAIGNTRMKRAWMGLWRGGF